MNRRNAIKKVVWMGSTATVTSLVLINQKCSPARDDESFIVEEGQQIITELADLLIPDGEIPGAKAANVGDFIVMMIKECYPVDVQGVFKNGIMCLKNASESKLGKSFLESTRNEQENLLSETLKEERVDDTFMQFFKILRELTLLGYFTSEIGVTQALEYVPVPGRYDGCVPMKSNQRAWAI